MPNEFNIKLKSLTLAAKAWGDKSKPQLLALHGWLDNAASFDQLATLLADDYYIVALDLPGHGLSEAIADESYKLLDYVDCVIATLDALGWQQCTILGHSLGGAVGAIVASCFPDRISTLISIDALGPLSKETLDQPARLSKITALILQSKNKPLTHYTSLQQMAERRAIANHVPAELLMPLIQRGTTAIDDYFIWCFDPKLLHPSLFYFSEQQVLDYLSQIQCPVLMIEAEHGLLINNTLIDHRKTVVSHLHVDIVPGHHHPHIEDAAPIAQRIKTFLQTQNTL